MNTLALVLCSLSLWYSRPAPDTDKGWECESLPLGCGWFGVSCFGGVTNERFQVTHNAVLTRNPKYRGNPNLTDALDIRLAFPHADATDYRRALDIENSLASVRYRANGVDYTREYFTSYPAKALVVRLAASRRGARDFTLAADIPYPHPFASDDDPGMGRTGTVRVVGRDIAVREDFEAFCLRFGAALRVDTDGQVSARPDGVAVTGATTATVYFSCETNYELAPERFFRQSCDPNAPDPLPRAQACVVAAAKAGYDAVRSAHLADYRALFGRVALDLGPGASDKPTDELLKDYAKGACNPSLEALYAQYGRYLLISCSRPGTLPANLQGVWAGKVRTPWGCGYWHNINVQMNYWPAFSGNLAECFRAYADFNRAFRPSTRRSCESYLRAHVPENSLAPGEKAPDDWWCVGIAGWTYLIGGTGGGSSGLTSKLFMDWWEFTQDREVLTDYAWPVMRGLAGFLVRNVRDHGGALLCEHSFSHEQFQDKKPYYTTGCAFDQQMIYENNADTLKLAEILRTNDAVVATIRRQLPHYEPILIGADGQIKEFREENRYGEIGEKQHRHISQLMALMPGTQITRDTPEWLEAAKRTLEFRGDKSTGWALAHRLNAWARTGDGEHAYRLFRNLLATRTYPNLWDVHPPFQIDGNFGGTSGVIEMLLQSHAGAIDILPALPQAWAKAGSFRGLCARGAFVVDCEWSDGRPTAVTVRSLKGNVPRLRHDGKTLPLAKKGSVFRFER